MPDSTGTTNALPTWDQLSDLDRGAALMHVWKRKREGGGYAIRNYPARYFDDPRLTALSGSDASRHAFQVAGRWSEVNNRLGTAEVGRLYDLALDADQARVAAELRADQDTEAATVTNFEHDGRTYQLDHLGAAVPAQYGEFAVYYDGQAVACFEVQDAFVEPDQRQGLPDQDTLVDQAREAVVDAGHGDDSLARCRRCGCTEMTACPGGCWWVDDPEEIGELCSTCLPVIRARLANGAPTGRPSGSEQHQRSGAGDGRSQPGSDLELDQVEAQG